MVVPPIGAIVVSSRILSLPSWRDLPRHGPPTVGSAAPADRGSADLAVRRADRADHGRRRLRGTVALGPVLLPGPATRRHRDGPCAVPRHRGLPRHASRAACRAHPAIGANLAL